MACLSLSRKSGDVTTTSEKCVSTANERHLRARRGGLSVSSFSDVLERAEGDALEQVDVLVRLVDALDLGRVLELVVAAKDARALAVHARLGLAEQLDERLLGEDLAQRLGVAQDLGADELEDVGRGRPAPDAEERLAAGLDVDVVQRERAFATRARVRGAHVALVRRLVLGEAHVAVDAVHEVLDREVRQAPVGLARDGDPGREERLEVEERVTVQGVVRAEPVAVVVLGELGEEVERLGEDRRGCGCGRGARPSGSARRELVQRVEGGGRRTHR